MVSGRKLPLSVELTNRIRGILIADFYLYDKTIEFYVTATMDFMYNSRLGLCYIQAVCLCVWMSRNHKIDLELLIIFFILFITCYGMIDSN